MGSQQVGLVVLGAILVAIAIVVAVQIFGAQLDENAKSSMINEMNAIASMAVQHRARGASTGGGGGTYTGFRLPREMRQTDNAVYVITVTPATVTIDGKSILDSSNTIRGVLDGTGQIRAWTYTGTFQ